MTKFISKSERNKLFSMKPEEVYDKIHSNEWELKEFSTWMQILSINSYQIGLGNNPSINEREN